MFRKGTSFKFANSHRTAFVRLTKRSLTNDAVKIEDIVNLCKRRGFVFPSNEIYSALSGFYDYGPLGVELKNNIKQRWWRDFVRRREDIVGVDCAIISPAQVWAASGHLEGFTDPMVDCKVSKLRYRADQVFFAPLKKLDDTVVCFVSVLESDDMLQEATKLALKYAKKLGVTGPFADLHLQDLQSVTAEELPLIPSPATGNPGDLTMPRDFNLMFQTSVGALAQGATTAYLRPETAQGIFANFATIQRTSRIKVPFGIAQIGKAFRNEITPRNFIFRSREFEQMEIEFFISSEDDAWRPKFSEWIDLYMDWLTSLGIPREQLQLKDHSTDKLPHYAKACTDIVFRYPFGWSELMGVAARGDFDLRQHAAHSGKNLEYVDPKTNKKYLPHVIEPSIGIDRLMLALLVSAYHVEQLGDGDSRVVLRLHPSIAPVKVVVLPLVTNDAALLEKARKLFYSLQQDFTCEWDQSGAIGRRYRRADECGAVCCVTVDFTSLEDDCVTVRDRDTMVQIRLRTEQLSQYIFKLIK